MVSLGVDAVGPPVPAAASAAVHGALTGPERTGRVLAAMPTAVYVDAGAPGEDATVVGVLTRDAVRLPIGVVLGGASGAGTLAGLRRGDAAAVGHGTVVLPGLVVRAARWWNPQVGAVMPPGTVVRPAAVAAAAALLPPLPSDLAPGAAALRALLASGRMADGSAYDEVAGMLVGLGPGLTPAGDDLLAGVLLALLAFGEVAPAGLLGAAVRARARETTALSAALLLAAADGYAIPQLAAFLRALTGDASPPGTVDALTRIGSTSGVTLACGALLATRTARGREAA